MIQLPVQPLGEEAVCFQDKVAEDQEEICESNNNKAFSHPINRHSTILLQYLNVWAIRSVSPLL